MNIVGVIRCTVPFIFGMLTVLLVYKIAASAKTVVKIIRYMKNTRRVISQMLRKYAK